MQKHNRDYALKAFVPGRNDSEREITILSELNHPGIPRFVESFSHNGFRYLVQEFIEGYPLSTFIGEGERFCEDEVVEILIGLLEVIAYLHKPEEKRPPVIHGDLRLSNIFWSGNRLHLIDFGFAQYWPGDQTKGEEREDRTCETMRLSRPGRKTYALLREEVSPRSDLFGVGVVGLDLFTNWVDEEKLLTEPWQDIFPGGDSLKGFIERLLIPEIQFASARDALNHLETLASATRRRPSSGSYQRCSPCREEAF